MPEMRFYWLIDNPPVVLGDIIAWEEILAWARVLGFGCLKFPSYRTNFSQGCKWKYKSELLRLYMYDRSEAMKKRPVPKHHIRFQTKDSFSICFVPRSQRRLPNSPTIQAQIADDRDIYVKGWMTRQFCWLIRISVPQNLPESNKSLYWAGDVVKNTVKSRKS